MKQEIKGNARDRVCLALDVDSTQHAVDLVTQLKDEVGFFKIGLELYTNEGPDVIKTIIGLGGKVFLDLKFHDIPHTTCLLYTSPSPRDA